MAPVKLLYLFLTVLTVLHLAQPAAAARKCAKRRIPLSSLCAQPPVVRRLDLTAYKGRWYQLFTTGFAGRFSGNRCVTANYTLNADSTINVLNCEQFAPGQRPVCVRGSARRRFPDDPMQQARLSVQFLAAIPPGPYNVAALLGNAAYGYHAAAVFTCSAPPPPGVLSGGGPPPGVAPSAGGPPAGVVRTAGGPPPGVVPTAGGPPPGVASAGGNGTTGGPPPGVAAGAPPPGVGQGVLTGFFVIGRTPWAPTFTLNRLRKRLRCLGYDVPFRSFVESAHPASCTYHGDEGSFDVVAATPFTAPPSVSG